MINKIITLIILFGIVGCGFRVKLDKPVHLSYYSSNVVIEIDLISKDKRSLSNKGKYSYFYYGNMSSKIFSEQRPKEILLTYRDEKSAVYLDTIVDTINFWDRSMWDKNGLRENKIYVVFEDPDIDWSAVRMIEK